MGVVDPSPPPNFTTPLLLTLNYLASILSPALLAVTAAFYYPLQSAAAVLAFVVGWLAYCKMDGAEYRTGRPDKEFTQTHWMFVRMRDWLSLKLHRTEVVQSKLLEQHRTGQGIFAFFPHGVNSDFRVLMDGMMYDAFPKVYEAAPARTLAASILFQIPGIRSLSLKTGCVDAGRPTATRCLTKGHSLMLCPGGQDEQIETICGRERVFLKRRSGFIRLALIHGVPVVPAYCFGSSDLYHTSRLFHGLRVWLVRTLRIALPLYSGGWGMFAYPTPRGFPRAVPNNVVFGDPISFAQNGDPSKEEVQRCHERFIAALTVLFDTHKAEWGYGDRQLEVL